MRIQLRDIVRKSECIVALLSENDIGSLVLIKIFLIIAFNHHVNVEMIIRKICVAAASISVEAVIESIVSTYEGTIKRRQYSEKRVELKMMIPENGSKLEHVNSAPGVSMSQYFSSTKGPSGTVCEDHKS